MSKHKKNAEISKAEFKAGKNAAQMAKTEKRATKQKTASTAKKGTGFFDPGKNKCWLGL